MTATEPRKIAVCGLDCATCPTFIATENDDDALREKTAKKWAEEFDSPDLKPEDMNCLGCLSLVEPLFQHCHNCEIRKCGLEKGVKNCGECDEYPCEKTTNFHKLAPEAEKVCDEINRSG